MRILFATHLTEWGGGEKWMLTAATAMQARGHAVWVAAPARSQLLARARVAGVGVLPVEFRRDFDPTSFWRIFDHCRRHRPHVLCLNMDRVLRIAGMAARLAGVPAVIVRRGSEFPLKAHLNYRFQYRHVATAIIVNSRATERALCQGLDWKPRGRIHRLYNGLDLSPYENARPRHELRAELGLSSDAFVLINIGELTRRKNARLLLEVLPSLRREHPHTHLLLVGEGPERVHLEHRIAELGLEGAVSLLGFRKDTADLLAASDLLVHTAILEGFGFVVAEAMAAGLPTVVSDASSLPEVIEHGVTGTLFASDDAADLERSILPYLNDAELCRRHGAAGRARVRDRFRLEDRMDDLEEIFRQEAGLTSVPSQEAQR